MDAPTSPIVAGFWRRFAADLVDSIALGVLGWLIAYPFSYELSALGARAAWLGLVVCMLYAGLLQTRIGQGQTLGKRVLGIQVLRRDGSYLSAGRSFGRYAIVSFVFFNGMYGSVFGLVSAQTAEALEPLFLFAVIFVALSCFLVVPLHPLKRGLHDLLADSVVVHKGRYDAQALEQMENPRRARWAFSAIFGASFLLIVAVGLLMRSVGASANLSRLTSLQGQLSRDYDVRGVSDTSFNGGHRTLRVTVWIPLRVYENAAERTRIGQGILVRLQTSPSASSEFESVQVTLVSGFNIGIAKLSQSTPFVADLRTAPSAPAGDPPAP